MFFVYIIQSQKLGRYYIGSTECLDRRLRDHNQGKVIATKNKGPWEIRYFENLNTRNEAVKREKQIKSYKSGNAFKKLINVD